jgi:hypothetical protein
MKKKTSLNNYDDHYQFPLIKKRISARKSYAQFWKSAKDEITNLYKLSKSYSMAIQSCKRLKASQICSNRA